MIATLDILHGIGLFFDWLLVTAPKLGMTPVTLFVVIVFVLGLLSGAAQDYNRKQAIKQAIRDSQQPKP